MPGSPKHLRPGCPNPPELRLLVVYVLPDLEQAQRQQTNNEHHQHKDHLLMMLKKLIGNYHAEKNPVPISIYYNFLAVIG